MLRFTIRDVLWLMVVVAVALGWWADRRWLLNRVRQSNPMLYETITGEQINTNRLKPQYSNQDTTAICHRLTAFWGGHTI
jgi:hypothetical protein